MHGIRIKIDLVEEVRVHEVTVALIMGGLEAYVFVQVERRNVLKADFARIAHLDELCVQIERR